MTGWVVLGGRSYYMAEHPIFGELYFTKTEFKDAVRRNRMKRKLRGTAKRISTPQDIKILQR